MSSDGYERRKNATTRKILDSAVELIQQDGPQAVTVEDVAARSGVAKTTIYRRFKNRYELLDAAAKELSTEFYIRDDYSIEGVIDAVVEFAENYIREIGLVATANMIASDEEFVTDFRERVVGPRFDLVVLYLRQGVKLGYFREDLNESVLRDFVFGALVYTQFDEGDDLRAWVTSAVHVLWSYLTGEPNPPDPTPTDQRRVRVRTRIPKVGEKLKTSERADY